ncbi:MAG TPA: hypothetical protein VFB02_13750 [Bradyrhizobium sp.]|nr:hypothetical protein [Bradyrhizobium sp.]
MTAKAPPRVVRPKFAHFLFDREVELREAAKALGCSYETVRRVCLPFADPDRRVPGKELMERIFAYTDGEIAPGDFYPAHMSFATDAAGVEDGRDHPEPVSA